MKRTLLAAGLTLGLHLILGLALSEHSLPEIAPLQGTFTVTMCQLLDRVPEATISPAPPAPNAADPSPPQSVPQAPAPTRVATKEPLTASISQRPVRSKKDAGEFKVRGEKSTSSDLAQSSSTSPESGHSLTPSVVQGEGVGEANGDTLDNSSTATEQAGIIAAPPPLVRQGLKIKPVYKVTPEPQYPALARRMGYQGTVELKVLVRQDGTVGELEIATSSGYPVLDRSALAAVKQWRFEPGTKDTIQEAMWIKIPVHFKLR